jgi:hypothetical protein
MTNEERKEIVRKLLKDGRTLSEIQDFLHKEKGDSITYMELRLLLSEMPDAKLPEKETPKPVPPPSAAAKSDKSATTENKLSISVNSAPPPGFLLSGYARFASGAKAHWMIDDLGRLGLEPELGSSKPTEKDVKEFTAELRRMLQPREGGAPPM